MGRYGFAYVVGDLARFVDRTAGEHIANSSPPTRATVSESRTRCFSSAAISRNSCRRPCGRSCRSTYLEAIEVEVAHDVPISSPRADSSAASRRRSNSARFTKPVSASWLAWYVISRVSPRSSLTSWKMITQPAIWPSGAADRRGRELRRELASACLLSSSARRPRFTRRRSARHFATGSPSELGRPRRRA